MDGLGTITHDYNTPYLDQCKRRNLRIYDSEYHKAYMREYNKRVSANKNVFEINPKWRRAYSGREEYA